MTRRSAATPAPPGTDRGPRPRCWRALAIAGLALAALAVAAGGCAGAQADPQGASSTGDKPLLVAGAADLRPAFELLGATFEEATGEEVTFSFGSSGQLAQQLIEGAPMDLYASANVAYVDAVLDAGVGDPATQTTYAYGRIAIWSTSELWGEWDSLAELVDDDGATTIAIANPEHAPYGLAAQQALESAELWDEVGPRLVYGENIADTLRLAATGDADAAVVALSLALAADEDGDGQWALLEEDLHEPLQQDLVVVADDPDRSRLAEAFLAHVDGEEGREVMRRYGFLLPDDEPPESWER